MTDDPAYIITDLAFREAFKLKVNNDPARAVLEAADKRVKIVEEGPFDEAVNTWGDLSESVHAFRAAGGLEAYDRERAGRPGVGECPMCEKYKRLAGVTKEGEERLLKHIISGEGPPTPPAAEREERLVVLYHAAYNDGENGYVKDPESIIKLVKEYTDDPTAPDPPALAVVRERLKEIVRDFAFDEHSVSVLRTRLLNYIDTLSRACVVEGVSYERLTEDMKKLSKTSRAIYVEEDIPAGHRVHATPPAPCSRRPTSLLMLVWMMINPPWSCFIMF
jgi:hypothetical protein